MLRVELGDRVQIWDYSDAHGEFGVVYYIQDNGIVMIELEKAQAGQIILWPITDPENELRKAE